MKNGITNYGQPDELKYSTPAARKEDPHRTLSAQAY